MLRWRLILGTLFIAALAALCWLDFRAERPGIYLLPLAVLGALLAAGELLGLYRAGDQRAGKANVEMLPVDSIAYAGTLLIVLMSVVPMWASTVVSTTTGWLLWEGEAPAELEVGVRGRLGRSIARPSGLGWTALGIFLALLLALMTEMWRYVAPGNSTLRLVRTFFAMGYAGGLMAMLVQLRLLGGEPWGNDSRWGMLALVTTIAVVKANDTGAYTAGRLFGRHKMTPVLSPGKTWEGAAGGMAGSLLAALLCLGPLARQMGCETTRGFTSWALGCLAFAILVGIAGMLGDLSISMLKRDAQVKDSSTWMPGFGGVLDLLDSILLAAPVSCLLWVTGVVGP